MKRGSVPAASSRTTSRTDAAIQEEQTHLDLADASRREVIHQIDRQLRQPVRDRTDESRHAMLAVRLRALSEADHGLVLGRIDAEGGVRHHIGRIGVPAADGGEPLVLDWRAAAARPFYTATALEPQGLRRRRHIRTDGMRVTGVDDEDLTDAGSLDDLVGEAALLAALDERRSGRMGTAVATLQREQDAIVRAEADLPLVVQGGPGTGKTVVALHRVAYLLFTHAEVARRGVLLLGPSRRFLTYVEQVLPALGETAVVAATCETVLPGASVERTESRHLAEIKGRASWWDALRAHVDDLVPAAVGLELVLDGEPYRVPPGRVERVLRAARAGDRSLLRAREHAFDGLREWLVEAVVERTTELLRSVEDGLEDILGGLDAALAAADDRAVRGDTSGSQVDGEMSEAEVDELRARVASDPGVDAVLTSWWPAPAARPVLEALLHDPARLAALVPDLTAAEVAAVVAEPRALAPSDIALLDAVTALIGIASTGQPDDRFVADRAASDPGWTYGHVVIDEAQELSAMQWHMVRRRCPTGAITAVGDIDQTEAPHRHTDWGDAVGPALADRWRRAELTICYRTPSEVMALVEPVLARAGSRNQPPRAVRSTGHEPRVVETRLDHVREEVATIVTDLQRAYDGGTVGIVSADAHVEALTSSLRDVPVLTASQAKGLEWDACVVVDPEAIEAGPRGANALYVALTRCTQELVQVRPRSTTSDPNR